MLPTAKDFAAQHARRAIVAVSLVREAIQARPEWRETVTHRDHAEQIARVLLTTEPQLVGTISAAVDAGQINAAMSVATEALESLFAADPYLRSDSTCLRPECFAWLKAQLPNRQQDELRGIANRADSSELWRLRYAAQHELAEKGADVKALEARINAANTSGSNVI